MALLKKRGSIATEIVTLTKAGDDAGLKGANGRSAGNAGEIATLLADLNPHWMQLLLADPMTMHSELTSAETVARSGKKYDDDIAAFDDVFTHAMKLSDTLSAGIIEQFPLKFE